MVGLGLAAKKRSTPSGGHQTPGVTIADTLSSAWIFLFDSLTVQVSTRETQLIFDLGIFPKTILLDEIEGLLSFPLPIGV